MLHIKWESLNTGLSIKEKFCFQKAKNMEGTPILQGWPQFLLDKISICVLLFVHIDM